ncbi:hypothetical protein A3G67_00755 [Candidatus Roizmanbacteria bacterium RIFCSPLOWO2_12_FULL_40_12]|uniref:Uncharacterized protein n=1 Tax=Candidatus Roizmanbacteria bacterium RIFCSPLOWO2_01_FULL_40_42 TaxID=1802066 RepID=A0A1F7J2T5_9BACT|nr:MAG: hypothetical protein A2779_02610 [Candidatus Roizmanbacteria bacterium RIFCSPHIGHO2_01_FULL_40_98]OGK28426.1 MAG: hypothetical protein A3C31_02925 [Candidatus Roizmanbacteria bacterium RIFCSPHIGHO2_02_FULL_40_53]OGK30234.1 MAG: hypothetical protein A2W49_04855 [Candidatus Roizmanbacteria bacterium RIFCSPHIGHO2_12_41_18]OGK36592.1 MAG: hypothetical protein A3E69_04620 [Candidatus Roizmanbacteria bacterium RIFCSPHIGHO2_12_FULL_40_130]OGK49924.1 MAG: hypothetical protein A3B50_00745 [Candi
MNTIIAQSLKIKGQTLKGPLDSGINNLGDVINRTLLVVIPLGAIALFFVMVSGGYDFLLSRGDPEKVKRGKAKLTTGLVGFILLVVSYLAVKIVSQIFGIGKDIFQ